MKVERKVIFTYCVRINELMNPTAKCDLWLFSLQICCHNNPNNHPELIHRMFVFAVSQLGDCFVSFIVFGSYKKSYF